MVFLKTSFPRQAKKWSTRYNDYGSNNTSGTDMDVNVGAGHGRKRRCPMRSCRAHKKAKHGYWNGSG